MKHTGIMRQEMCGSQGFKSRRCEKATQGSWEEPWVRRGRLSSICLGSHSTYHYVPYLILFFNLQCLFNLENRRWKVIYKSCCCCFGRMLRTLLLLVQENYFKWPAALPCESLFHSEGKMCFLGKRLYPNDV